MNFLFYSSWARASLHLLFFLISLPFIYLFYSFLSFLSLFSSSPLKPTPNHSPTILITGASSGLGKNLALHYASKHAHLLLFGRSHDRLKQVADQCLLDGASSAQTFSADVTNKQQMCSLIEAADDLSPIDIVIANAGITAGMLNVDWQANGTWAHVIETLTDVNLLGVFNTIHPLVERFRQRQSGQIVLMSSLASIVTLPAATGYSVSKMALRAYGDGLRDWLANSGVGVSVICPGYVSTPLTKRNRFSMPLLMHVEEATTIMAEGIRRNDPLTAFPFPTFSLLSVVASLPHEIRSFFASRFSPAKKVHRLYKGE